MHDLGKLAIPEEILRKPGALTDAERVVLERHPQIGFRMLESLGISRSPTGYSTTTSAGTAAATRTGSPASDIPLGARIVFVADAFDAMTSDRVYRGAGSTAARRTRRAPAGAPGTQFDPQVVAAFVRSELARSAFARAVPAPRSKATTKLVRAIPRVSR